MKNLIVGVDGSAGSLKAIAVAAEIAAATNSRVVLAHVLPVPSPLPPEVVIPPGWIGELTEAGNLILKAAAEQCTRAGAESEARVLEGAPDEALARLGAQLESDFIAVGSRGRGAVSRLLLGSVADKLLQTAGRPVLIAR